MGNRITNRFVRPCRECGNEVATGEGFAERNAADTKWETFHRPGECPPKKTGFATATGPIASPPANLPEPDGLEVAKAADDIVRSVAAQFMQLVPSMVRDEVVKASRVVEIKVGKAPAIRLDHSHMALPDILTAVVAGTSPFLVGPAGSGKTTIAEQIAGVLKRKFYMAARVTSEHKLIGFVDAQGRTVRTQFRDAYEKGGVFLFDEVDASDPDALTAFNAALANGLGDFPDGMIRKHRDFVAIAAGNTFGRGADRQYVGRNQLDAATLDRFVTFEVDYDEDLELSLAGDLEWAKFVQRVRRAVEAEKVRHIVSPRASIFGSALLASGMARDKVEAACLWKGLDDAQRTRVANRLANVR